MLTGFDPIIRRFNEKENMLKTISQRDNDDNKPCRKKSNPNFSIEQSAQNSIFMMSQDDVRFKSQQDVDIKNSVIEEKGEPNDSTTLQNNIDSNDVTQNIIHTDADDLLISGSKTVAERDDQRDIAGSRESRESPPSVLRPRKAPEEPTSFDDYSRTPILDCSQNTPLLEIDQLKGQKSS